MKIQSWQKALISFVLTWELTVNPLPVKSMTISYVIKG